MNIKDRILTEKQILNMGFSQKLGNQKDLEQNIVTYTKKVYHTQLVWEVERITEEGNPFYKYKKINEYLVDTEGNPLQYRQGQCQTQKQIYECKND